MRALNGQELLDVWDRGNRIPPVDRALMLAAYADTCAEVTRADDDRARLPLGRRDALLLHLRAATLGSRELSSRTQCPTCHAVVEFAIDPLAVTAECAGGAEGVIEVGERRVAWRCPDSRDVAAAAAEPDPDRAERALLARCAAPVDGTLADLTPEGRAAVVDAIVSADPLSEVLVDLRCPDCDTHFVADVDVESFVWQGLRARAERLLDDVDALAKAYGWRERDVVALPDERRAAYLRLVTAGTR